MVRLQPHPDLPCAAMAWLRLFDVFGQFAGQRAASDVPALTVSEEGEVRLRLKSRGEWRVLTVPRDLTYGELMFRITDGMGYGDVVFKYFDGDDTITVRSTEDLLEAYNFLDGQPAEDKRGGRSLRVTLEEAMVNETWSPATSHTSSVPHAATPCCSPSLEELIKAEADSSDEFADDSKLSDKLTDTCSATGECEFESELWSDQELLDEIHAEHAEEFSSLSEHGFSYHLLPSPASLASFPSESTISCDAQSELCEWFAKFRRVKQIGAGSFASVWQYMDPNGLQFAVKQVATSSAMRGNGRLDALQNEMRLYRDLCHENIVRCFGMVVFEGTANIILELAPMGTISQVVKQISSSALSGEQRGLTLGVARNYLTQILAGLEYLHVNGVVHRDLKCDNVLVDANGHCKLADFGAAKSLEHVLQGEYRVTLCGTPEWLAPEALIGDSAERSQFDWTKCDVWSLACTLIEMLTAASPWHQYLFDTPGLTVERSSTILFLLKKKHKKGELPSGLLRCADGARDFLGRCLQPDPISRPSTTELCSDPFITAVHMDC